MKHIYVGIRVDRKDNNIIFRKRKWEAIGDWEWIRMPITQANKKAVYNGSMLML